MDDLEDIGLLNELVSLNLFYNMVFFHFFQFFQFFRVMKIKKITRILSNNMNKKVLEQNFLKEKKNIKSNKKSIHPK